MISNYEKMLEIIKNTKKGTTLLLHSCCAPCSSHCLSVLKEHFDITVLFYNPNIDDFQEYEKRKLEQINFLSKTGWAKFIDVESNADDFHTYIRGFESEKEGGLRCRKCYKLRLSKTAHIAKEKGFEYFGTTLTVSPLKNALWINEIGEELQECYGINFLFADFKKQNGYLHSINLSKEYGLYRQNYCGCSFSKNNK